MQPDLRVLRLVSVAVVALLLGPKEVMHRRQPPLAILDPPRLSELVIRLVDGDATAVEADAPQRLERDVDEPVVVHGTSELDVTEVTRVGLVVEVAEAGIIDSAVDWLPSHVSLVFIISRTGGIIVSA